MVSIPIEDLVWMGRALQVLQQTTYSFAECLLDGLANEIKRTDFEPVFS